MAELHTDTSIADSEAHVEAFYRIMDIMKYAVNITLSCNKWNRFEFSIIEALFFIGL